MSAQDSPAQRVAERYGAPSPWRRRAVVAASGLLAVVFAGWLGWTVYEHATPKVTSELESFSVDDDHTVTAVLVVSLDDADVKASCTLRATAEDHTTVGELTFTPDPGEGPASGEDHPDRPSCHLGGLAGLHRAGPGPAALTSGLTRSSSFELAERRIPARLVRLVVRRRAVVHTAGRQGQTDPDLA